jgi:hypothetical protein
VFSPEEILALKEFCQRIINRPRPIDDQPHKREGIFVWCEDWEMIEICKYLFNGREAYYGDPPPNRLKFNPLWSKDKIAESAETLTRTFNSVKEIIDVLEERRNHGST